MSEARESLLGWLGKRFQEADDGDGFFTAFLGVSYQGDAVGAFGSGEIWEGGEHGLDDVEPSEHGSVENVHASATGNQEQGDVFATHVTGAAEGGFPVTSAPVPGGVEQAGLLGKQGFGAIQIKVADTNKLLDHVEIQARRFGRGLWCALRENLRWKS